jgi:hypothetical protein
MTIVWVAPNERMYGSPMNVALEDRDHVGTSEGEISRISVRDRGSVPAERQTLMHEIVHTILWLTGHARDDDEAEVQALAVGLVHTLRANPVLCSYLLEGAW